jgi:hypothetical protein
VLDERELKALRDKADKALGDLLNPDGSGLPFRERRHFLESTRDIWEEP